jgi:glycine/D-amino acid oxidase-like deaminating enzyme
MTRFPISLDSPVEHADALPGAVDLIVVGGGVIGVMSALFARRSGLRVLLLEKGRIAGEQSSRNWGWIRQQGRDPDELPIMVEANRLWRQLAVEAGEDIGLAGGGVTYLARSPADLERYAAWLPHAHAHGVDSRLLSREEVRALIPDAADAWLGAIHTPSDLRAEPWRAVPALARLARREGVLLREACAVRGLDIAAGRVAGVITERGRVQAPAVVLAGGAWSSLLLRRHGIRIPQLSVRATVAAVAARAMAYPGAASVKHLAWRPRDDGGYSLAAGGFHELFVGPDAFRALPSYLPQLRHDPTGTRLWPWAPVGFPDAWMTPRRWDDDAVSPFERCRVLDPTPNRRKVGDLVARFARTFPGLGPVSLKCAWAGMIDTLPDVVPVIDRVAALPGLTVACGMSGHGFGIGPGVGRVVADLVQGHPPGHDLSRFRFARFSDGSAIRLGPAL